MFTHHGAAPQYPRGPLKRFHDEGLSSADLVNATAIGFNEHRNKRLHTSTLPLRTSPSSRKWALAAPSSSEDTNSSLAITPPSSFLDNLAAIELQQQQLQQQQLQQLQQQQHQADSAATMGSVDMDMDMAMDDPTAQPLSQQGSSSGHPLVANEFQTTAAARIPTPLQPSFAAQVRGGNWGGAPGNAMQACASSGLRHPVLEGNGMVSDDGHNLTVPRSLANGGMGDWGLVQNRSLPSPISESGGEEGGSPDMAMDGAMPGPESQQSHLLTPTRPSASSSSPMGSPSSPSEAATMDTDAAVLPSPKKGHTRSRHTIVAWTAQPGMKKSFSIGYRSDCEKCRNRVPGHFNHIIVS